MDGDVPCMEGVPPSAPPPGQTRVEDRGGKVSSESGMREEEDLLCGEQANPAERRRVSNAALYVLAIHALVAGQRGVELLHHRVGLTGEDPAPR